MEAVGGDVESFSKGDPVAVVRPHGKLNDERFGAFQQYALATAATTTWLPSRELLESAASSILNLGTAAAACSIFLGLDRPNLQTPSKPTGEKIFIYGGSSSCGGLAITYATAAGYEVITTTSPKNHEYVSSLGPVTVIDHTQPASNIIQDIERHGPYRGILDTIGLPPVTEIMIGYLSLVGGGTYFTLIPQYHYSRPIPENINCRFESYSWVLEDPKYEEFRNWFYGTLVSDGLASGTIRSTPPQRVGGGLHSAQHALDLMNDGLVSAHKLIVDPWET